MRLLDIASIAESAAPHPEMVSFFREAAVAFLEQRNNILFRAVGDDFKDHLKDEAADLTAYLTKLAKLLENTTSV